MTFQQIKHWTVISTLLIGAYHFIALVWSFGTITAAQVVYTFTGRQYGPTATMEQVDCPADITQSYQNGYNDAKKYYTKKG